MGHIGIWLRFIISVPLIFLLGKLASNFAHGIMEFSAIIVYAIFLWLAGFFAYFLSPYKLGGLGFFYLYFWGVKTVVDTFVQMKLDMLIDSTLNPFVFMGMVAVLCFLGLWSAYKENQHYSTVESP